GEPAPTRGAGEFLAETVEVRLGETALEERPGIHPRRRVALEVDLVTAAGVVLPTEEVVEPHLVEGRHRGVGGDVPAHGDAGALGAGDHHGGVPPQVGTETTFH